jgi:sugar fermentation stimulation protein A
MKYEGIVSGRFLARPNRFIAHVEVDGIQVVAHVKNTGRCKELLTGGCTVYLQDWGRRTPAARPAMIWWRWRRGSCW